MIGSSQDGFNPKLLVTDLDNTHANREALQRQLRLADHPDVAVLHPQAAAAYSQKVVLIQGTQARRDAAALEAVALVRGLVHEILVTPRPDRMDLEVVGDLVELLEQSVRRIKHGTVQVRSPCALSDLIVAPIGEILRSGPALAQPGPALAPLVQTVGADQGRFSRAGVSRSGRQGRRAGLYWACIRRYHSERTPDAGVAPKLAC